jgi:hypothetical protein
MPLNAPLSSRIHSLRGQKVMLSPDLADLYGVQTKALVQAVKRNRERFPPDFIFQLTEQELRVLRSQFVTLSDAALRGHGTHAKYTPYAFTEQGVAMLSSVLKSRRAIQVNVEIMRAFVRLRDLIGHNRELAQRLDVLESKYDLAGLNEKNGVCPHLFSQLKNLPSLLMTVMST